MTNPTPVAWISGSGILSLEESNLCCSPLFTEAQLNQARADALREAAELCDRFHGRFMTPAECAGAIRRMADEELKGENDA